MMRSGVFRINLNLNNNFSFKFKKSTLGNLTITPGSFTNNSGMTNPLMIAASYTDLIVSEGFVGGTNSAANRVKVDKVDMILACGSSCLPCLDANEYTVSICIGQNQGYVHSLQQCRLYIPYYTFAPHAEELYLSHKQKTNFIKVDQYQFDVAGGAAFNRLISNGTARMKRLIMVGIMTPTANANTISPMSSPFCTEPSTTSPFYISNFNCLVGSLGVYANAITYNFEQFLLEYLVI
jgi:hypothetical protein